MRFKKESFWLAIGLVAAFGLGLVAVLTFRVDAASDGSDSTFVAMSPCRLFDTRPEYDVGVLTTFGPDEAQTASAHGDNGECTIPADAIALSLNVTAVNATLPTHLTVWSGGAMPTASSLNPAPGGVAFNAVTVPLTSGAFQVYNLKGILDVIVDVNGYYRDSTIDDLETRLAWLENAQPVVSQRATSNPQVIDDTWRTIGKVDVPQPSVAIRGTMIVDYAVNVEQDEPGAVVECAISDGPWRGLARRWESPGNPGGSGHISASAELDWYSDVTSAPTAWLQCRQSGASSPTIATNADVIMTFYPDPSLP